MTAWPGPGLPACFRCCGSCPPFCLSRMAPRSSLASLPPSAARWRCSPSMALPASSSCSAASCWLIGLFTRPVAFLLSGMMAVAYFMAHAPKSFFPVNQWRRRGDPVLLRLLLPVHRRAGTVERRRQARRSRCGLRRPTGATSDGERREFQAEAGAGRAGHPAQRPQSWLISPRTMLIPRPVQLSESKPAGRPAPLSPDDDRAGRVGMRIHGHLDEKRGMGRSAHA